MQKIKLSIAALILSLTSVTQAQWESMSNSTVLVGSQLSQQFTASSTKFDRFGNQHTLSYMHNDHQEVTDVFNRNQSYQGLRFTNSSEINDSSAIYFSSDVSRNEQHLSSVLSVGNWRFGVSVGQAENFVKTNNLFTGVDPYFIHGGRAVDFDYYGANAGYEFNSGSTLYFGSSTVQAERLEDRQANYLGYAGKNLSTSIMNFQRGGKSIGKGIEFTTHLKNFDLGYRQLSRNNGAHSKTFSLSTSTSLIKAGKIGFALESSNNPLNRQEDDLAFMLTLSGEWGKPAVRFNLDEAEETEKQSTGINKMVVIGAAVVAGAVIASSGGSSGDDNEIIVAQGQDDAAFQVLNRINPESVRLNREHGGWIYRNPNGTYGSTEPKLGNVASINLGDVGVPNGTRRAASYHTHGGPDPRFDNENFSPQDLRADRAVDLDGYLGTPAGFMKHHDVKTGRIRTVRRIAN